MPGKGWDTRVNRLRKSGIERRQRDKNHIKRLMALGVTADKIVHMNSKTLRTMLHKLSAKEQPKI